LFTIIFYRIIFYEPVAEKLLPTFAILIAPPAVGMIAYFKLAGQIDNFARILYYFALFLTILTLLQIKKFAKLKFYLSWWAYSFPLAAISIATIVMFDQTKLQIFGLLGYMLLILLINIILILLGKTIKAVFRNEICIKE
jgi:tellurite resistance protein